jgi:regulator of PEP synthase PpsR (kinase-PPPase family)
VVNFYELIDRRSDWPVVDMTSRSIEEAAAEVVSLLGRRQKDKVEDGPIG